MPLFLSTLLAGGQAYTISDMDTGFDIEPVEGHFEDFNALARLVVEKDGQTYVAFPRSNGHGGSDCVHIVPIDNQRYQAMRQLVRRQPLSLSD